MAFFHTQVSHLLARRNAGHSSVWPACHGAICDLTKQLDFFLADFETFVGKHICVDRNYFVRSKNIFKVLFWPQQGAGDRGLGLAGWESQ